MRAGRRPGIDRLYATPAALAFSLSGIALFFPSPSPALPNAYCTPVQSVRALQRSLAWCHLSRNACLSRSAHGPPLPSPNLRTSKQNFEPRANKSRLLSRSYSRQLALGPVPLRTKAGCGSAKERQGDADTVRCSIYRSQHRSLQAAGLLCLPRDLAALPRQSVSSAL